MAQFLVRAYRSDGGVRVVVDGITHFDAPSLESAEPRARAVIADRLRAYLPERAPPRPDPQAVAVWGYSIELDREELARGPTTDPPPAAPPKPGAGGVRPSGSSI